MRKFDQIKEEYDQLARLQLSQGKLLYKGTSKGLWGISALDETFELFKKLRLKRHKNFVDLGSGDGRVTLVAALFTKATGLEIDPQLHQQSLLVKRKLRSPAKFVHGDFLQHDLTNYDFVYCFPDTPLHRGLEQKLKNELQGRFIMLGHSIYPVDLRTEMRLGLLGQPVTVYRND